MRCSRLVPEKRWRWKRALGTETKGGGGKTEEAGREGGMRGERRMERGGEERQERRGLMTTDP